MSIEERKVYYEKLNLIRLLLALMVTWSHCFPLIGVNEPISNYLYTDTGGSIAVKSFFFISGYLVTKSWLSNESVASFLLARFLRIWPALTVAIFFGVFLAALTSHAEPNSFLLSAWSYIKTNILIFNHAAFNIKDAFVGNKFESVNGSLWTLPWEIKCYLVLLLIGVAGILSRKEVFNLACLFFLSYYLISLRDLVHWENKEVPLNILCFFIGSSVFVNLRGVPVLKSSFVLIFIGALFIFSSDIEMGVSFFICGVIYFLGFSKYRFLPNVNLDISFGVYIYSFPIQQAVLWFFHIQSPIILFLIVLIPVVILSALSWLFIEKPALKLRHYIKG